MKLEVSGQGIGVTSREELVSGTVNVYRAEFSFDQSWAGYTPVAVFEGTSLGDRVSREQRLFQGQCTIPWETLLPGGYLRVGVYGLHGDSRLPTIYTERMFVARGTEGAQEGREPTPDMYRQLLGAIEAGMLRGEPGPAPYIGENGRWYVWDAQAEEFQDSGVRAQGEKGEKGDRGEQGDPAASIQAELAQVRGIAERALGDAGTALAELGVAREETERAIEALKTALGGLPYPALEDNPPEVIQAVARLGLGANFWSVGDRVPITLNGMVGALTFEEETYYAFILGFDHNEAIEGKGIHFQLGKLADGTDIAFVDEYYGSGTGGPGFRMNQSNSSAGGWAGCYLRSAICPAFLAALPERWRRVVTPCVKYTDNAGGMNNNPEDVTQTSDEIFIPSYFEVFGNAGYGYQNSGEPEYQQCYAYYANGNSRVKYSHKDPAAAVRHMLRSNNIGNGSRFLTVGGTGEVSGGSAASTSLGFAPCFQVA